MFHVVPLGVFAVHPTLLRLAEAPSCNYSPLADSRLPPLAVPINLPLARMASQYDQSGYRQIRNSDQRYKPFLAMFFSYVLQQEQDSVRHRELDGYYRPYRHPRRDT